MIRVIGLGDNVVDCNYTTKVIYPGGNSYNFAVMAKRLGYDSAYAGVIGNDWQADEIIALLERENVDISHCHYESRETGVCGIHLTNGDRTIVEENDAGVVKAKPYQVTEEEIEYLRQFDLVHSSCYSHIENQLKKIKDAGISVLYDFSDEWTEETLSEICANITIAFFSGKDLAIEDLEKLVKKCVNEYGCELAITTFGERGAMVYNGRKLYKKQPYNYEAPIVDTTGAGDSWITAFITSYFSGMKIFAHLHSHKFENFSRKIDQDDYVDHLIEFSMCSGNLFARHNCLMEGSLGYGIKFEEGR